MTVAPRVMFCIIFVLLAQIATCLQSLFTNLQQQSYATDCGSRPARREPRSDQHQQRTAKIIAGTPTKDGQFPWQASLELLHPSMGFLGHWCGAVLIHRYWILSAAHCVHNDLFNLPLPPLWTVVLGEHDRVVESGYEQRIPVEKIVLHKRYHNFLHDLVLMKLSLPADIRADSNIRRICLPFAYSENVGNNNEEESNKDVEMGSSTNTGLDTEAFDILPEKTDNFLRSVQSIRRHRNVTVPSMKELMSTKIMARLRQTQSRQQLDLEQLQQAEMKRRQEPRLIELKHRRNDKLMKVHTIVDAEAATTINRQQDVRDLPYVDCVATGWGKANISGDLTDKLLKTKVPLHNSGRCKEAYGSFVKIHRGHICAGQLNGKGGTCVGDSGGPLQCRLTKGGPWILAGITSFGSGCAIKGFPDVYTRTSFYMKWIQDTITYE